MKALISLSKDYSILNDQERAKFDRWFGKSVVRNPDGTPKRVYHGTTATIKRFEKDFLGNGVDEHGVGFYFTDTPTVASGYAQNKAGHYVEGSQILPCYIRIIKPLYTTRGKKMPRMTRRQAWLMLMLAGPAWDQFYRDNYDPAFTSKRQAKEEYVTNIVEYGDSILRSSLTIFNDVFSGTERQKEFASIFKSVTGYDGVVFEAGGVTIYAVFSPLQIKSAVGNSGRFRRIADIDD